MPKSKQTKIDTVADLTERLSKAKSVVFADFKGLNMSQLSNIRNKLLDTGGQLTVTKNNLLKLAVKQANLPADEQLFEGPTATLFAYDDEISPIKVLTKALKDSQIGKVKGGLLNGEPLDATRINMLANLPTKDELRAKVVGSLGAPLYGMVGVLQANLRNLVYALEQIRVTRGGE